MTHRNTDFIYEQSTGRLYHARNKSKNMTARAGAPCSTRPGTGGYLWVHHDGRPHQQHRVVWWVVYGEWPKGEVDHIDHDRTNNRLSNLRVVDRGTNSRNCRLMKNNTSGHNSVHWDKKSKKWVANVCVNGKQTRIGQFDSLYDAIDARRFADERLEYHSNHGKTI
jgi:hypothetical protein